MSELKVKKCSVKVYPVDRRGGYPCSKKAVVERDGKWYCKIHDPEYVKAKAEERQRKWDEKWAERKARMEAEDARRELNKQVKFAFLDMLDGDFSKWQDIQYNTGLGENRSKEIAELFKKVLAEVGEEWRARK